MSEVKPVIKTWQEEAKEWPEDRRGLATNQMIWMQQEIAELRAALEALQKENNSLKLGYKAKEAILQEAQKEVAKLRSFDADNKGLKECNAILTEENAEQAKRIADLEAEAAKDHVKILSLKDALSAYGDPDVFADDED